MPDKFEDVIKYNVYEAIKIKVKEKDTTPEARKQNLENNPANIPNNPILLDYDWVYEHAEEIFARYVYMFHNYQSMEAYYIFFKAITTKYNIENDYNTYLRTGEKDLITIKWWLFGAKLIEFMSYLTDDGIKELLKKKDFVAYFLRYHLLYDWDLLKNFCYSGMEALLENEAFARYCIADYNKLIQLIRKHPKIQIPTNLMQNKKIIGDMVRTLKLEEFHFYMTFILEQCSGESYYEEHKKFCDTEVANIQNGILPYYQKEFNQEPDIIDKKEISRRHSMQNQVFERIFERFNSESISKSTLYQEFSKYMIIGMFISSHFETAPYNLMVDIETLFKFARENNRELRGSYIYDFLINFESKTLAEVIAFYHEFEHASLKEMLYDDWKEQEGLFVSELNANLLNPQNLTPQTLENGVIYYDISDVPDLLLVHETSIKQSDTQKIEKMLEQIKTGYKERICLSVQDQEHNTYYHEKNTSGQKTIKFLYGPLNPSRVGIVYHKDAYSMWANFVEYDLGNLDFIRRLYTPKSLLAETYNYNEINYMIAKLPFLPIGIICEDEITDVEIMVAKSLNIPLLYRKTKKSIPKPYTKERVAKYYHYTASKTLF
ncbi:MAG: hypothetical protein K2J20_03785 [Bacilli bacterium]|nr:hypothetical protein [Bacilli bacterium]